MPSNLRTLLLPLLLGLTVAACGGGGSNPTPAASVTATVGASAPAVSSAPASPTDPSTAPAGGTVNANTATQAELQSAFDAVGIPNADRWAREVAEYRPYEADPTWGRLRQELGKYNIDPAVLQQILAILTV